MDNVQYCIAIFLNQENLGEFEKTIKSLQEFSKHTPVYLFFDGDISAMDLENIKNQIPNFVSGEKTGILLRNKKIGYINNIIDGCNFLLKKYQKVIVIKPGVEIDKNTIDSAFTISNKTVLVYSTFRGLSLHPEKVNIIVFDKEIWEKIDWGVSLSKPQASDDEKIYYKLLENKQNVKIKVIDFSKK